MEASVILDLVKALPAPAAATLVLVPVAARVMRRTPAGGLPDAGEPAGLHPRLNPGPGLGIAAAMLVGLLVSKAGGWAIPPRQSTDWFAISLYLAALASIGFAFTSGSRLQLAIRVAACVLIATGVSWKLARTSWTLQESVAWIGGLALGSALVWVAFDRLTLVRRTESSTPDAAPASVQPAPRWSGPLVLAVWTMLLSQGMAATDSLLLGKVAAMLSACFGAATLILLFVPSVTFTGGPSGVAAILGCVLLFGGLQYTDTFRPWMAVMLAAGPVMGALLDAVLLRRLSGIPRAGLRVAAVGLLPLVVLAIVVPAAIKAAEDPGY